MMQEIDPLSYFGESQFPERETANETTDKHITEDTPAPKPDMFSAFENALGLPVGSTSAGMQSVKVAKQQAQIFKAKTDLIKQEANALVAQEQAVEISDDVLKEDRERIRAEAWELYQSGKEMFNVMKDRFMTTIAPTDRMYTAVATMLNSMSTSLTKLLETNTKLRKEDEHYREVQKLSAPPEMSEDNQSMDMTPDKMNAFIDKWTADFESKIDENLRSEIDNRAKPELPKPQG